MTRPIAGALLAASLAGGILVGLGLAAVAGTWTGSTKSVAAIVRSDPTPAESKPAVSVEPTMPSPPTPEPSPAPTASPAPSPTPRLVPAPLDGTLVSPELAARHPIAVMVDDLGPARPQSGFGEASVVWHAPAEGGIPRYMMVFGAGSPTSVGPVRSARQYFIAWAAEWRALYVHAGGSPQALQTLRAQGGGQLVYDADEFRYGRYLWRIKTRSSPHNLYTDGAHLRRLAGIAGATEPPAGAVWRFTADAPPSARPAGGRIEIAYPANRIRYDYDRSTNTYLRSVSREGAQTDAATGQRVAPKNVVILRMRFGPLNDGSPDKHRLEADVVGKGKAWIATNGRTTAGTWRKDSPTAPTLLFDAAGQPVTLTIGQTFVQVVPLSWGVSIRDGKPAPPVTEMVRPTRPAAQ